MNGLDRTHHIADFVLDHWQEIKTRFHKQKEFSLDFIPELDNCIWGLRRKSLVVVAGRPSQGKSTLMLQMAYTFALEGRKTYYFSLEMSKEECLERLLCNYCSIDNFNLHTGQVENIDYENKIKAFQETVSEMNLIIIESWGKDFKEILEITDTLQTPDIIFIDYVNLIRQGALSKKDAIDEYIKSLRQLALDRNFCIVLGAQINRDVHRNQDNNKNQNNVKEVPIPNMWNLKESGNLEEVADMVLIVHWPHYYRFAQEGEITKDEKEYFIRVAKNRTGRTGLFVCDFLPEHYRITSRKTISDMDNRGID